ncbi:hypothetical protein SERLADRAFT_415378 [Serpula lacrymans var. lacrymans S7.9]|uniref:Cytoplasmic tRNA 2-thiolation protein 2 n=1 Tax=Serpula lacrymans var. lacrymans (strain S7.9) TaxID=578457 RepID=F8NXY4_SERL9|nr:uncharacterized protein SERLADRAFT_415378 [Serpula lacrymans var. lacrymans S7.9]EGO24176.1 hypothetical protein SERLADRAFT_415378 [Serpula lacrymans var. lacrymans S7.9]
MSSCGNPATEVDALMPRRLKFDRSKDCVRCKEKPGNIVIRHAVYCKDCFTPLVNMKFRKVLQPCINKTISSSRRSKVKADGNLLISCSGGLGSSVLLDLVHRSYFSNRPPMGEDGKPLGGKDHPRNETVWKSAAVCYVEICNAYPEMRDRTEDVRAVVESYPGFEFIPIRLENAFDASWWESLGCRLHDKQFAVNFSDEGLPLSSLSTPTSNSTPLEGLRGYLTSLPTQTAIFTRRTRSSHLLLGTSLTSLSVSLISSISQGGGYALREELQEEWSSEHDDNTELKDMLNSVRVVRPLRDIVMKECAAYARWNNVKVVGREKLSGANHGIGGLTKDFIVGLERDYPSTVSTIARTCAKLAPKDNPDGICLLCQRPRQKGIQEWKTRISIRSYDDAKLASDSHIPAHAHPSAETDQCCSRRIFPSSFTPYLCYFCHTTLTSRSSRSGKLFTLSKGNASNHTTVSLPGYVSAGLSNLGPGGDQVYPAGGKEIGEMEIWERKKTSLADMKGTVAEFLLDD